MKEFSKLFQSTTGHPPKPIRLIVGLLMLQHMFNESDELVVIKWVENPYWQFFCGYDYLQWEEPIDPTSLVHWRKRLGKGGLEKILKATIATAVKTKTINKQSLAKTISDTTVMPKNITYPTDSKLYAQGCKILARKAKKLKIPLRQSFAKLAKRSLVKVGRYAHARQMKRAQREQRRLKTYLGRLYRDLQRKLKIRPNLKEEFKNIFSLIDKLLNQKKLIKKSSTVCLSHIQSVFLRVKFTKNMNLGVRFLLLRLIRKAFYYAQRPFWATLMMDTFYNKL